MKKLYIAFVTCTVLYTKFYTRNIRSSFALKKRKDTKIPCNYFLLMAIDLLYLLFCLLFIKIEDRYKYKVILFDINYT